MKIGMKIFGAVVLLGAAFLAYKFWPDPAGSSRKQTEIPEFKPYNVLLISMDTTRRDHLSCYGYEEDTTPNIDKVASESLKYNKCMAVSNWTLPTHASMLSGLYPITHGARWVTSNSDHINGKNSPKDDKGGKFVFMMSPAGLMSTECDTLAETLGMMGYRTGAVVSNYTYVNKVFRLDQGFDHYDDSKGNSSVSYRRAKTITDEALGWLKSSDEKKPFFMFLNYMDPHKIYSPPKPWDTRFAKGPPIFSKIKTGKERANMYHRTRKGVMKGQGRAIRSEERRFLTQLYDGEIGYMDFHMGRLFDWLRDKGLYDDTLIIITADHGESLGEHRIMGHAFSMYEPEIDVPMIVKTPGSTHTGEVDYGVQHPDIMPTVFDVLELPPHNGIQGVSMLKPTSRDLVSCEYIFTDHVRNFPGWDYVQYCLRRGDMKYIEYSKNKPPELYNLKSDPLELRNLNKADPQTAQMLKEGLAKWKEQHVPLEEMQIGPMNRDFYQKMLEQGYITEN